MTWYLVNDAEPPRATADLPDPPRLVSDPRMLSVVNKGLDDKSLSKFWAWLKKWGCRTQ